MICVNSHVESSTRTDASQLCEEHSTSRSALIGGMQQENCAQSWLSASLRLKRCCQHCDILNFVPVWSHGCSQNSIKIFVADDLYHPHLQLISHTWNVAMLSLIYCLFNDKRSDEIHSLVSLVRSLQQGSPNHFLEIESRSFSRVPNVRRTFIYFR